eukprot:s2932_g5.t1
MVDQDAVTLDVPEPQILLHFAGDQHGLTDHHRLLLVRLGPGRWIASSPDHELEVLDLTGRRHRVLSRRSRFPADILGSIYAFDPLSRADHERLKREAKPMAVILGDEEMEADQGTVWVFADAGASNVGQPVPFDVLGGAVTLNNRGLVEIDGEVVGVEEIPADELSGYAEAKKGSLGDLRLIGQHLDSGNRRFILFKDAFPLLRQSEFQDWQFKGPRAVREFLGSIQESGTDLGSYHLQWVKNSGINQHTGACHEHRNLIELVRLGLCRNQLDVSNLMSMELAVRRVVQIEVATSRNASNPDYSGLEVLLENPLTETGAASTRSLDEWVTSKLKEKAQIAKQTRLFKEETSHASKNKGTQGDGASGGGPWRKRKPKAKASPSAGGAGAAES